LVNIKNFALTGIFEILHLFSIYVFRLLHTHSNKMNFSFCMNH
jgi:hypothetical protein